MAIESHGSTLGKWRTYAMVYLTDLLAGGVYLLVATAVLLIGPESGVVRAAIAVPFLLFVPGYAVVSALFPRRSEAGGTGRQVRAVGGADLRGSERLALGFGVSLALIPPVGVVLGALRVSLTTPAVVWCLALLSGAGLVVATVRRTRLPPERRFKPRLGDRSHPGGSTMMSERSPADSRRSDSAGSTARGVSADASESRVSALEDLTARDAGDWPRPDLALLVVSTFGGGGIHHYTDEQVRRLDGLLSVSVHDMRMQPTGSGFVRFVRGVLAGLFAIALFPFRARPDVVHVHTSHRFSFYRSAAYVLFAAGVWRVPVVVHVHGSAFDEFVAEAPWWLARFQRLVFDAASEVVVLSELWREVVGERVTDEKIRVVPNAVDSSAFEANPGGEPPHVVFVSNLFERKGVRELVAAIDELCDTTDREFRVSVAGDGPLSDQVVSLAERHDHVSYLGYVSEERKRSLLADGSIYVLPTYAEGLPIAMLEGMAGGNAVVSTRVAAIPEVIDENRGILVEPGDVGALTDALETLVELPERTARMGERNRQAVEQHYSWDRVVEELLCIYDTHIPQ